MPRSIRVAAMVLLAATTVTAAKPVPREKPKQPITAANAHQVVELSELPLDIWEIAFGPKPGQVIFLGWEETANVLDAGTFTTVSKIGAGKRLIHIACDALGERVAFCENTTSVEIVRLRDGATTTIETGQHQPGMMFSPSGKLLATGGFGNQATLWDAATGKLVRALDAGPVKGGLTVQFSPNGKHLAVGNRNSTTRIFEVETGKLLHTLERAMSQGLRFSPDGKTLAVTYVDGSLALWNVADGKLRHQQKSSAAELYSVSWSAGGDVLATVGREGRITLWKAADLSVLKEFEAPEWVIRVYFTPDGSRFLTSGGSSGPGATDRKVTVWGLGGAR